MKIAICTPVYRDTSAQYSQCLARLIVHSLKARSDLELDTLIRQGSSLLDLRNTLVGDAGKWGADYILWLDADQAFPADSLLRLLDHGLDIVGCNYPKRADLTSPTAMDLGRRALVWTTPAKAKAGEVEQVGLIGLGVALVKADVFRRIEWPYFNSGITTDGQYLGEDAHFCNRASENKIQIWCDHGLSWQVGHLHQTLLTNLNTIADKTRFQLQNKRTP